MTKTWWFNLYTLPFIKKLAMISLVSAILGQFSAILGNFTYISLVSFVLFKKGGTLAQNIEFHKMSIPFLELRTSLLKDVGLCLLSFYLFSLPLISSNLEDIKQINLNEILFYSFLVGISFVLILLRGQNGYRSKHGKAGYPGIMAKCKLLGLILFYGLFFLTLIGLFPAGDTGFLIFIFTCSLFPVLFQLKAFFHQEIEDIRNLSFASNLFYTAKAFLVVISFYFLCVGVGRNQVLDSSLSIEKRLSNLEFNGYLNPPIDKETFLVIEPAVITGMILYSSVNFDPSSLGVSYFLEKGKETRRLEKFIKYGKPSNTFFISLFDHFLKNPGYWDNKTHKIYLQHLAYNKWPSKTPLPDRFVVARDRIESTVHKDDPVSKTGRQVAHEKK